MKKAVVPENEKERLASLKSYFLLDTNEEKVFDDVTRLAAKIAGTPIALISLVDENRQWFKSKVGLAVSETPRDISFCGHAIHGKEPLIVEDTKNDTRFVDNPLVINDPKIRFYAGVPLVNSEGYALGTLCVIDRVPKKLSSEQIEQLQNLSTSVIDLFALYKRANSSDLSTIFFNLTRELHCVASFKGFFLNLNPAWTERLGWSEKELKAKPFMDFVHHEDRESTLQEMTKLSQGIETINFVNRYYHKNGSLLILEWSATALLDKAVVLATARDITNERKSKTELNTIFESMSEGVVVQNSEGAITQFNLAAPKILGLTDEELTGRTSLDARWKSFKSDGSPFPGQEHPAMVALKTGRAQFHVPMIVHKKDGTNSWISINSIPMISPGDDHPYAVISTFADLSALHRIQLETKYAMDFVPTGIFRTDINGNCTYVNNEWKNITGLSEAQAMGTGWSNSLHPDDKELVFSEWKKAVTRRQPFELIYRFKKPDDTTRYVHGKAQEILDPFGVVTGYLGSVQDITSLKTAEEFNTFYKIALDQAAIVAMTDPRGKITYVNEMFCKISGYSEQELLGQDHRIVNSGKMGKQFFKEMWETILSGKQWHGLICNRSKSGREYWVDTVIVPFLGKGNIIEKYISIRKDVTKEHQQQIELEKAYQKAEEATKIKSDFLSTMSHEIRTPLNGVIGMAQLLLETNLSKEQRDIANTITQSGKSLLAIVNDILDFSKIEAGKMELEIIEFHLGTYIKDLVKVFSPLAAEKKIALTFSSNEFLSNIMGDQGRIGQIVTNLISNAMKFTHQGGVHIELVQHLERGLCKTTIQVKDTGIGIRDDSKEKLFNVFTQAEQSTSRKYGGTGLGLSISKKLTDMMNGTIGFTSKYGEGTTFELNFIFKVGQTANLSTEDKSRHGLHLSGKILVAEDNRTNQIVITRTLEKIGLVVQAVANGNEVISALKNSHFDLILMDCQMPEMDGYEATQEIRKKNTSFSEIPIIALTANSRKEDHDRCINIGMNDYISKPIDRSQLESILKKYLSSEVCIIDTSAFKEFDDLESDTSPDLLVEIIDSFLATSKDRFQGILESASIGNIKKASSEAHNLKSSAQILGAISLSDLCQEIENAAQKGVTSIEDITTRLQQIYPQVILELEKIKAARITK